jgi:hypothetical protein
VAVLSTLISLNALPLVTKLPAGKAFTSAQIQAEPLSVRVQMLVIAAVVVAWVFVTCRNWICNPELPWK